MSSTRGDFALLLAAPDPVEADLARDLLSGAGIPSLLHGQDRDFAEMGAAIHMGVARPDLLVPRSALERARELLRETWSGGDVTDEMAVASPVIEEETGRSGLQALVWLVFVGVLVCVVFVTYSIFFQPRAH